MNLSAIGLIKVLIASFSIGLVVVLYYLKKVNQKQHIAKVNYMLFLLVLVAFAASARFQLDFPKSWDSFHYFMGSKYFDELGYFKLYGATIVADYEMDGLFNGIKSIRNTHTYRFISSKKVLSNSEEYKCKFTPIRWEEFKKDLRFWQNRASISLFKKILNDNGYMASPVWTWLGRFLTNMHPLTTGYLYILCYLDILLLLAIFVIIYKSFDVSIACISLIFYFIDINTKFMLGNFLRLPWLAMLLGCICSLKTGRYKTAGLCLGASTALRIFPGFYALGILFKSCFDYLKYKKIKKKYIKFLSSYIFVCIVLFLVTLTFGSGHKNWNDDF